MATQASQDTAVKERIIHHMNADHQDSLVRYLEHYLQVSSFAARNALMEDMSMDSITVTSNGKRYLIPLEPPMDSWRDSRDRLVKMDKVATSALGRSEITVKEYRRPQGLHAVVFVVCAFTFLLFARNANFLPGSYSYHALLKHFPNFSAFCARIQPLVLNVMIVVHGSEAYYMATRKLRKHSVPVGSMLWFQWTISNFIEGVGAFQRFNAIVNAITTERETKAH
ncbi:hypothetical protein K432DRAFT_425437 [Lepidopterella palustris CBS 459.81]|uniref:DUF2470 domain-containing protein n=1 Tax=Lepidopterella palustris CBS 459.81 TaxID=1314670 RepID=A0A8E2JFU5_9PEZI|nr:hypothetical protein K432DRAFT_425437 [Lepidopterella palustris CBS 459.81]